MTETARQVADRAMAPLLEDEPEPVQPKWWWSWPHLKSVADSLTFGEQAVYWNAVSQQQLLTARRCLLVACAGAAVAVAGFAAQVLT